MYTFLPPRYNVIDIKLARFPLNMPDVKQSMAREVLSREVLITVPINTFRRSAFQIIVDARSAQFNKIRAGRAPSLPRNFDQVSVNSVNRFQYLKCNYACVGRGCLSKSAPNTRLSHI